MLPPHELKNKTFTKAMRGYNPVEVDEYIDFLIEKYTELYRENDELERKLKTTVTRLEELKSDEDSIRGALIDAKRAAAKIKADAEEHAEAIIRAAKTSCNTILADFNEKIETGRETYAIIQQDTIDLKNSLFQIYSDHIRFIDKLTEGIDEEEIPEVSELRRQAVDALKSEIAGAYAASQAAKAEAEPVEEPVDETPAEYTEAIEEFAATEETAMYEPVESDEEYADDLTVEREPLNVPTKEREPGLRDSVKELNKRYKESDDVINTPDSDLGDDASYMDFVKSVTGRKTEEPQEKDIDFQMLFDETKKKKKK